ncbi:hypothetical protein [Nonomuraea salmonea]|uniref:hypothetical protein n=1 Tax=Nonomuraea salmonea TaxID=46181 RepID=UPI0031E661FF
MSLLANRATERGMDAATLADDLDGEQAAVPAELGGPGRRAAGGHPRGNVPRQPGAFSPYRTEREVTPGSTSNADW